MYEIRNAEKPGDVIYTISKSSRLHTETRIHDTFISTQEGLFAFLHAISADRFDCFADNRVNRYR
jgi:hypothetical protein